jgi:hypothetical protein
MKSRRRVSMLHIRQKKRWKRLRKQAKQKSARP